MKNMNLKSLTGLKALGVCAVVAALAASALPTASAQTGSPLPTPEPTVAPTIVPPPLPPAPTPVPTARVVRPGPVPKIITKQIQQSDAAALYEVDVKYPAIDSTDDAWIGFNTLAEAQAQELVTDFTTQVTSTAPFTDTAYPTNTLMSTFEAFRVTRDFVSIRSTVSTYMAGAAHPNSFSRVINYDARTGKDLALADLFRANVDYLNTLATYCKRNLQRRGLLDFPEGADPKPENYANWNLGRFNLVISFDPYQVAPYAAGRVECQVPLATLRRVLAEPRRW